MRLPWFAQSAACVVLWLCFAGCQRTPLPAYQRSRAVAALSEYGETAEEQQMWADLQSQIDALLVDQVGTPAHPKWMGDPDRDVASLQRGAEVYARRCEQCHGVNGDGQGPVASYLSPRPRDYTRGIFKFTSTPGGARPRRVDLLRTIRYGVTGASMPSFDELPELDLQAVADYVIVLSQRGEFETRLAAIADEEEQLDPEYVQEVVGEIVARWTAANNQIVQPLTPMPERTPQTVQLGHAWFLKQACNKCHGKDGRGGSMGDVEVGRDAWGHETAAADLTSGMFHGGGRPIDIYRRIYSGINGTPMPGFAEIFQEKPDVIWYLVHFVKDLGERRRENLPPLTDAEIAVVEANIDQLTSAQAETQHETLNTEH